MSQGGSHNIRYLLYTEVQISLYEVVGKFTIVDFELRDGIKAKLLKLKRAQQSMKNR